MIPIIIINPLPNLKVALVTFATYVYSGDDHVLSAEKAFVCLSLFDIIRLPLALLPLLIVYMVEVPVDSILYIFIRLSLSLPT